MPATNSPVISSMLPQLTEARFTQLLERTLLNQRIAGYVLTAAEIAEVRKNLRASFGMSEEPVSQPPDGPASDGKGAPLER